MISELVEKTRSRYRVAGREMYGTGQDAACGWTTPGIPWNTKICLTGKKIRVGKRLWKQETVRIFILAVRSKTNRV